MITAHTANTAKLAIIILVAALALPYSAWAAAGNVQICQKDSTCTVGEFLYDDSYVPITTASCAFNSRYPNGDIFVSSQPMASASASDGWYSYDVVATGSAGIYRSTICCQAGSDYLCLDKSFEVSTASALTTVDVANAVWDASRGAHTVSGSFGEALQNIVPSSNEIAVAVWEYSDKTLTEFGSLISDIWSYSTRSLNDFGTLATAIWNNTTRTLTGTGLDNGSLATVEDIKVSTQSAVATLKGSNNKDLTDISNEIANVKADTGSIKTTVEDIQTTVNLVYIDTQSIKATTSAILTKWGSLSASDVFDKISTVSARLGTENDTSSNSTVFGHIAFIKDKWGSQTAQDIYDQAAAASNTISLVRTDLNYSGKSTTVYEDIQRVIGYVDTLEALIGTSSDISSASTLFGKMKSIQDKVDLLTSIQTNINDILSKWGSSSVSDITDKIKEIKDQLTTVSTTTSFSTVINQTITNNTTIKELKNELLTMKAVTEANQTLLEKVGNKPIVKTFLIEGSVIFRSLLINPSQNISQTVPFQYYLPSEVKKEDVLELDKGLTIIYDSEKNQYYASGDFTLAPSETKTISIRVEDIWKISDEQIASLRKQAEELYKPLVNTSYFGQAVTIKSDIDVSLDKIAEMQKTATTPEKKIVVYRDAQIELKAVGVKIDTLKQLVSLASSAGSLVGFVGGAQAFAVWGIIIIMVTGFVFLVLYMRALRIKEITVLSKNGMAERKKTNKKETEKHNYPLVQPAFHLGGLVRFAVIVFISTLFISGLSGFLVYRFMDRGQLQSKAANDKIIISNSNSAEKKVLGEQSTQIPGSNVINNVNGETKQQKRFVKIQVSKGAQVSIYRYPISTSAVVTKISASQDAVFLEETTNWIKVNLNLGDNSNESPYTAGWVDKKYIQDELQKVSMLPNDNKQVYIDDTFTGFLYVRKTPAGVEIGKVNPGETYPFVQVENNWLQIELEDGTLGWISKQYASIK